MPVLSFGFVFMEKDACERILEAIRCIDTDLAKMLADACIADGHVTLQCRLISKILADKGIHLSPDEIDSACSGYLRIPGQGYQQIWDHLTGTNYHEDEDYYAYRNST